jgi:hypothetical protein
MYIATQNKTDSSAANRNPNAVSLMQSSLGNLHRPEGTIGNERRFRYLLIHKHIIN